MTSYVERLDALAEDVGALGVGGLRLPDAVIRAALDQSSQAILITRA